MSYRKEMSMKVIRTKHIVEFAEGDRAKGIKGWLEKVPPEARLIEIDNSDIITCLTFEEEVADGGEGCQP